MEDDNETNKCKSSTILTDGEKVADVADDVKERCRDQRDALPGEPKCVICGRYGEYICDETDDDICSLECKHTLLCRVAKPQLPVGLTPPKRLHANDECFYVRDTGDKSGSQSLTSNQTELLRRKLEICVKGDSIPAPILSFSSCSLPQKLLQNIEAAGYEMPTPVQMQAIPAALIGKSLLVSADTGSGKTASFLVPIVSRCASFRHEHFQNQKKPLAIVLTPTRELCIQVEEQAKLLGRGLPFKTALVVGGDAMAGQLYRIQQGVELIVGTPGRLIDLLTKHEFELDDVMMFVLDEVDCMLQRGFRDQVMQIVRALSQPQVLMYSATISQQVEKMASSMAKDINVVSVGKPNTPNKAVKQLAIWVESKRKKQKLFDILMSKQHFIPPVVVYVGSRLGADLLSNAIKITTGIKALSIHGEKSMKERREIIRSFLVGEVPVIVATGVLGRGVDLLAVRQVIVFDMPNSVREYVHQIGRASRVGEEGTSIAFVNEENKNLFPELVEILKSSGATLPRELVNSRTRYMAGSLSVVSRETTRKREREQGFVVCCGREEKKQTHSKKMERNSAACAMEWSIELDKGLRSKTHGRAVEAILEIGPRLEQWGREPQPRMAVYDMFGLVPGEDRLFANTILLRLSDAFRLGDKNTRLSVVKVFLSDLKNQKTKTKRKHNYGIFSKPRVHNQSQLLARVKCVFDTGDVESRALALALFGCWAHFAIDSAQIRYLILSSLLSSHVLEVKASLFAAGYFCELSDDFAYVVLEMLVHMVTSSEISPAVRLAGLRVFAKMGCSYSIANSAYKTGLKLVSNFSEEDFLVAMLVSLSKLASKFTILISEQVELLFSFLTREKTLHMQETTLRCLHFIFMKGGCHFPVGASIIKTLFSTLDEPELPSALQCEALRILHKILLHTLPNLPGVDMLEFAKLLTIIEDASQSSNMSKSLLAIRVLADMSSKLGGRVEMEPGGVCSSFLPSRVISLIIDRMTLLVKSLSDLYETDSEVFQEVENLLNLLLLLIGAHPNLGVLVLDKIYLFIESLANMHESNMATRQEGLSVLEILELGGGKSQVMRSKLVFSVYKFVLACLENLKEAGAITTQVFDKVKVLEQCIHQCSLFDCYTHTIYSLLLHSRIIWGCMVHEDKENCDLDRNLGVSFHEYLVEHETFTLECAKKMLTERDYWPAYRAGVYAACQGAWFTATFIFEQLIKKVQSESCCCWLKSLVQFSVSEGKIQVLLFPKQGFSLVNWLEGNKFPITLFRDDLGDIGHDTAVNISLPNYGEKLVKVYYGLCSSGETLETTLSLDQTFCFQRWFLAVRAKVLGTVVDILRVLGAIQLNQDDVSNKGHVEKSSMVEDMRVLQQITPISYQFKRLAQEFDLIATSFIDMDSTSSKIISALALSCSLLGFSTGFALFIPKLSAYETFKTCGLGSLENCLHSMLVQNLNGRLWHTDRETSMNLNVILGVSGLSEKCFHLPSRNPILDVGCEAKDVSIVCKYAVSGILCLQDVANGVHNEEILSQVTKDGLRLLLDIIMRWLRIPSRTPKYFFKVRPCIGSELFAFNVDTSNPDGISTFAGSHLSLNLCLQLKNVPPDLPVRLTKLYCILYCRVSYQVPRPSGENKEQMRCGYRAWESDDMVEMNEKLLQYVECTKKTDGKRGRDNEEDDGGVVKVFVCFEPNERGQGFSNCLLDVSGFPVGCYRMKWHSCCIDSRDAYWSLLPLNAGPIFTVQQSHLI